MTLIIAGLGNIGSQYQYHRHNLGFIICDLLSERFSARRKKSSLTITIKLRRLRESRSRYYGLKN